MVAGDRYRHSRSYNVPVFCFQLRSAASKLVCAPFCANPCVASQSPLEPARRANASIKSNNDLIANESTHLAMIFGGDFFLKGASMLSRKIAMNMKMRLAYLRKATPTGANSLGLRIWRSMLAKCRRKHGEGAGLI